MLARLAIRSSYYSHQERLAFIQEMRLEEEFVLHWIPQMRKERNDAGELVDIETGAVLCVLREPDLTRFEFLREAARLVLVGCPDLGGEHLDHVNYREIERALEAFEASFSKRAR